MLDGTLSAGSIVVASLKTTLVPAYRSQARLLDLAIDSLIRVRIETH
jgi:hypothetical protein